MGKEITYQDIQEYLKDHDVTTNTAIERLKAQKKTVKKPKEEDGDKELK